jgi:Arc/MetJ family transcription regulator
LVSADGDLLRRAADVLGTSSRQATVTAALREVVARQQQNGDLARLRDQVERIAVIAGQALRGMDTSDT